ncbi:MAG: efflux RND transporter permease subunit, partial [Halobacteria archaeon]|nr:efflux RND transporter permease subunit [Halobacteria archaeon]
MVHNRVAPNLLMLVLLIGGLFMAKEIKKEVFPDFALDEVRVTVAYPGASPEEVEQGIVLAVEEAINGIEGVDEIRSTAREGSALVIAELMEGADVQRAHQDIKQEIDRITTFPDDAEEPEVNLALHRRLVQAVVVYGEASEWALRELTEQLRDRLLQEPGITQVDLVAARDFEIRVEISRESLRRYGLTLEGIARTIDNAAIEIPGGSIKTSGGEILLRVKQRRDWAEGFGEIPVITTRDGSVLRLRDIAQVSDVFEDVDRVRSFNGQPAMSLEVYRVGEQTPLGIAADVRKTLETFEANLPPGVHTAISIDQSRIYQQRLELLTRNGLIGLALVLVMLGIFLEIKLAFWVTMGIPTAFLGAILFLPGLGVSINMVSMFAFIIALGIVVDDAIIAGENIYEYRQRGMDLKEAAIRGARDVAVPVSYSILTNIVAFMPLYFVPGMVGKIFVIFPFVVGSVFVISWVEALFILPSHLAHSRSNGRTAAGEWLHQRQQAFSHQVRHFIRDRYGPVLRMCLYNRYLTVAVGIALLVAMLGFVASGRMGFVLMPTTDSDRAVAEAVLPYGSPLQNTLLVRDRLVSAAEDLIGEHGGDRLSRGILAVVDDNQVTTRIYLTDPGVRPLSTAEVTRLWRERVGQIPGMESLKFQSNRGGPASGAALTVELSHRDVDVLDKASSVLAEALSEYANVKDIDDGFSPGKQQLDFRLLPEGRSLGLTAREVARQVRSAFYGAEALRQQRGRNEIKVKVMLPASQRVSEYDIEQLLIHTPGGGDVPLRQVAEVERSRAYTSIDRRDGRRTVNVTADVEPRKATTQVLATLKAGTLQQLVRDYPGLTFGFEGQQADMRDSMASLMGNFAIAMIVIFALLAIPFRSYIQPVIVMAAIPFGLVGAVIGHIIMGYSLSIISMMGLVALAGVVVNDSLVMIVYANDLRRKGTSAIEAIQQAGIRRFRPILLTTITTFGGLAPMIFETSRQARFMIPMAISLGYGILFATLITLLLVPSLYLIIEDLRSR